MQWAIFVTIVALNGCHFALEILTKFSKISEPNRLNPGSSVLAQRVRAEQLWAKHIKLTKKTKVNWKDQGF